MLACMNVFIFYLLMDFNPLPFVCETTVFNPVLLVVC